MRWPKKRELLAFYFLSKEMQEKEVSAFEIASALKTELCLSMATSRRIVKRLLSLGMLERGSEGRLKVRKMEDYFEKAYSKYKEDRCRRKKRMGKIEIGK
ncbi:MAG: hypothetical protein QXP23_05010 [Fervidicoccaceae archaeon]